MNSMFKTQAVARLLLYALGMAFHMGCAEISRTEAGTLSYVYPLSSGQIILLFTPTPAYFNQSGADKQMTLTVGIFGLTQSGTNQMFATALTTIAAGKSVYYM